MGSWLVAFFFVHIGELASNVQVRMRARVVVSVDYKQNASYLASTPYSTLYSIVIQTNPQYPHELPIKSPSPPQYSPISSQNPLSLPLSLLMLPIPVNVAAPAEPVSFVRAHLAILPARGLQSKKSYMVVFQVFFFGPRSTAKKGQGLTGTCSVIERAKTREKRRRLNGA